ncbi:MAG: hypothetical protein KIT87_19780 [Anaerolineae bacterium]|nr:hypothetical protein [Anaerolineae bacterium]
MPNTTKSYFALPLLLALGWLSMGLAEPRQVYSNPALHVNAAAPGEYSVRVSSRAGWQQTPLFLRQGEIYWIAYDQGGWSVDALFAEYPYVGPEGYDTDIDPNICCPLLCKVDISLPYAYLLGSVGTELDVLAVGRGGRYVARRDGYLALRINDQDICLGDNGGAVQMVVGLEVDPTPSPTPSATATARPPSPTRTATAMATATPRPTLTPTPTRTPTTPPTSTSTLTSTTTPTAIPTSTLTATLIPSPVPTLTPTTTPSATPTLTPTPPPTLTLTPSVTPTLTATATPSASPPPLSQHLFLPYLVQGPAQ